MTRHLVIAGIVIALTGSVLSASAQEVNRRHKTYPKKYYKPPRDRDEARAEREKERAEKQKSPDQIKPSRRDKWSRKLEESDSLRAVRVQEED